MGSSGVASFVTLHLPRLAQNYHIDITGPVEDFTTAYMFCILICVYAYVYIYIYIYDSLCVFINTAYVQTLGVGGEWSCNIAEAWWRTAPALCKSCGFPT